MQENHDFIVIGGGSGGIACARRAAGHGAKVLLIESNRLGGTCVNVGCVPKKIMWTTSQIKETLSLAKDYGFSYNNLQFDWSAIKNSRDQYVSRLNEIYSQNLSNSNITVINGEASFVSSNVVQVNQLQYQSDHILIATGGEPDVPNVAGAEHGITSDIFFDIKYQPNNVLIAGSGYIATELASLLNGLGSNVTVVLRKDTILRNFDEDIYQTVMQQMQQHGVQFVTNTTVQSLYKDNQESIGYTNQQGEATDGFDCAIWAIGRRTKTKQINLDNANIQTNDRGEIKIDEFQNTSQPGIYAVGDVTPNAKLTPVAIAAGRTLADRLFNKQPSAKLDYSNIPSVIFSHPPVGTVGLSEKQAIAQYGKDSIRIYKSTFVNMRFSVSKQKPQTMMKLIVTGEQEKVLGCHIVGEGADEMMQGFAVVVKMGVNKQDFDNTIAIHPTAAEEMVTLS